MVNAQNYNGGGHRTEITNTGGGWSKLDYNATLWLHLAIRNLPDSQLSRESKIEPSVAIFALLDFFICIINQTLLSFGLSANTNHMELILMKRR